jgi:hypothetical protein
MGRGSDQTPPLVRMRVDLFAISSSILSYSLDGRIYFLQPTSISSEHYSFARHFVRMEVKFRLSLKCITNNALTGKILSICW